MNDISVYLGRQRGGGVPHQKNELEALSCIVSCPSTECSECSRNEKSTAPGSKRRTRDGIRQSGNAPWRQCLPWQTERDGARVGAQANRMVIVDCWRWCDFFSGSFSHVTLNCLHLGVYYIHSMIVLCSLMFKIIPFSGDSSRTGPFCASPVAYSIVHPPIEGESASIENQSWFPLVVVMTSMVDCNEMSIAANPPFLYNFWPVKTCQVIRTLH